MLKLAQLHSKVLVQLKGQEFMISARTVDGADDDDTLWNIFPYSWEAGIDITKPVFTASSDWYIVVTRKSFEGTEWEESHVGILSLDLLLVALNVNGYELAELQPC